MKKITLLLSLAFLFSCKNTELETRLGQLEKENLELKSKLDSVNTFIHPFKDLEKIILNEVNNSPDSIISKYNHFIKRFPDSYWSIEAKKRVYRIDARRSFWTPEKGWDFPKLYDTGGAIFIKIPPHVISCPSSEY
ncbi:hypothetical protein [Tenacibaculum sp. Ill]|uniref:hypothetical protein n=1 Tax=Tenacibaculum sp. Ill TaxID=3445935 RepID=UPI003F7A0A0F